MFKVPTAGLIDHVTAVLVVPVTLAVKELEVPAVSETVEGTTVMATLAGGTVAGLGGTRVIEELALTEELVALVAINVTEV